MQVHLKLNERAVIVRDKPERALGPGRHMFWRHREVMRWNTDELVFTAPAAVAAVLPAEWYESVHVAPGHYGIVWRDERAVGFLRPGLHRVWKVEAGVAVRVHAEADPLPELTDELKQALPAGELLDINLELNMRAVVLRDGRPDRVLDPGHHAFWGKHTKTVAWNIDDLVFTAQTDVLAMLPARWYRTVELGPTQRAVVERD